MSPWEINHNAVNLVRKELDKNNIKNQYHKFYISAFARPYNAGAGLRMERVLVKEN